MEVQLCVSGEKILMKGIKFGVLSGFETWTFEALKQNLAYSSTSMESWLLSLYLFLIYSWDLAMGFLPLPQEVVLDAHLLFPRCLPGSETVLRTVLFFHILNWSYSYNFQRWSWRLWKRKKLKERVFLEPLRFFWKRRMRKHQYFISNNESIPVNDG